MSISIDLTIGLSVTRILESVYAASAAEHITSRVPQPVVLGTSHEPLLRNICRDITAGLIFAISTEVADTNINETPTPEIIEIVLSQQPKYINLTLLRRSFEITIVAGIMAAVWGSSQPQLAATFRRSYEESCSCLRQLIARGPENIIPSD